MNDSNVHTENLSEYEMTKILPVMVVGLRTKLGVESAVTNRVIVTKMVESGYEITEPRVRKIIHHLRVNGLVPKLIASSKGYYIATDKNDLKRHIDSLSRREAAIRLIKENMEEHTQ